MNQKAFERFCENTVQITDITDVSKMPTITFNYC